MSDDGVLLESPEAARDGGGLGGPSHNLWKINSRKHLHLIQEIVLLANQLLFHCGAYTNNDIMTAQS